MTISAELPRGALGSSSARTRSRATAAAWSRLRTVARGAIAEELGHGYGQRSVAEIAGSDDGAAGPAGHGEAEPVAELGRSGEGSEQGPDGGLYLGRHLAAQIEDETDVHGRPHPRAALGALETDLDEYPLAGLDPGAIGVQIDRQCGAVGGVEGLRDLARVFVQRADRARPRRPVEAGLELPHGAVAGDIGVGPVAPGLEEGQVLDAVAIIEKAPGGEEGIVVDLIDQLGDRGLHIGIGEDLGTFRLDASASEILCRELFESRLKSGSFFSSCSACNRLSLRRPSAVSSEPAGLFDESQTSSPRVLSLSLFSISES